RRIAEFLELPYDPAMLTYHQRAGARLDEVRARCRADGSLIISKEKRLWNQRFCCQPPQAERIFRWKQELSADERRDFEEVAGNLLDELGYETACPEITPRRGGAATATASAQHTPAGEGAFEPHGPQLVRREPQERPPTER